jgi:hypothetical protein
MVRHRWISQDGKACLLASWFLSRDVAVHSGVVGASAPAPRCFKFRRKTRLGALEARQLPTRRFGKTLAQPPGDSTSCLKDPSVSALRAGALCLTAARTPPPRGARSTRAVKG